jgi:hypothetical protein
MGETHIIKHFTANGIFRATAIGFTAVLLWATLALLTNLSGQVPPFQLTAMAFSVAFLIGLGVWVKNGKRLSFYTNLARG